MQWLGCDQDEKPLVEDNHGNSELMLFSYCQFITSFTAEVIFRLLTPPLISGLLIPSSHSILTIGKMPFFAGGGEEPEVVFCWILVVWSKQMLPVSFIVNICVSTVEIKWYAYKMLNWVEYESSVLFLTNEVHQECFNSLLFSLNPLGQIQA